jgi:DNA repair protein RadC
MTPTSQGTLDVKSRTYRLPVLQVRLVREDAISHESRSVRNASDAAQVARAFLQGADRETFIAILLNTKHKVLGVNLVSIGGLDSAPVHPREVYKPAILAGAKSVIVAHNHPSGDPEPSNEDVAISGQLKRAGEIVGIPLLDHVVVGDTGHVSLCEKGLL